MMLESKERLSMVSSAAFEMDTGISRLLDTLKAAETQKEFIELAEQTRDKLRAIYDASREAYSGADSSMCEEAYWKLRNELLETVSGSYELADTVAYMASSFETQNLWINAEHVKASAKEILSDFVNVSNIQVNKFELQKIPFNPRSLVESSVNLMTPIAVKKELTLAYHVDDHVPFCLLGDYVRLRQVLWNLLNNAVKFTDRGKVVVTVTSRPLQDSYHELYFTVQDTGVGIPENHLTGLFESFIQTEGAAPQQHRGIGIGLLVSRRLCEAMGGTIWVESELGEGSVFHFTILVEAVVR